MVAKRIIKKQPTKKARTKKVKPTRVLLPVEQTQVCQWFAMFHTSRQIEELVLERYEKKISHQTLDRTYKAGAKWKPIITKLREEFLASVNEVPIANKIVRMKNLQRIYEESMTWRTTSVSEWGSIEKLALKAAIAANTEARREIEGEKGGDTNITINISERMTAARKKVLGALGKNRMPDAVSQN